jgi:hypothetical protein
MKPRADSAHRRNPAGRKIIGEELRSLHPQRIGVRRTAGQPGSGPHVRGYVSAADDHHQQLVLCGSDKDK